MRIRRVGERRVEQLISIVSSIAAWSFGHSGPVRVRQLSLFVITADLTAFCLSGQVRISHSGSMVTGLGLSGQVRVRQALSFFIITADIYLEDLALGGSKVTTLCLSGQVRG